MNETLKDKIGQAPDLVDVWTNRLLSAEHSHATLVREAFLATAVADELEQLDRDATHAEVTKAFVRATANARQAQCAMVQETVETMETRRSNASKALNALVMLERERAVANGV